MIKVRSKRWISALLALVLAFSLLPVSTFAAEECAHTNVETVAGTAATCTKPGTTDGVLCWDCRTWVTPQTAIPALGHKYVTVPGKAPTCTANGLTDGEKCSVCGDVKTEQTVIGFTGHTTVTVEYQAPTCTEPGHTAGSYCSACGAVLTQPVTKIPATGHNYTSKKVSASCDGQGYTLYTCQNVGCGHSYQEDVVDALGHKWDEGTVTSEATCTEAGVRTFTCSVCRGTKTEEEPATGHKWEDVAAKLPTYSTPGYDAHQRCPNCGETTLTGTTPALKKSDIKDYDTFMKYLKILEDVANDYAKENPGKDPLGVMIKYIRTGVDRYNSGSWKIMAGYEDADFVKYVEKYEENYNLSVDSTAEMIQVTSMKNIDPFALPSGEYADIGHMFGTMDISYTNITSENHADVAGWGGDLCDLLSLVDQFGVTGTLEEMVEEIGTDYFLKSSFPEEPVEGTFSGTDFIGDLDGLYVMQTLNGQEYARGQLYQILDEYFTEDLDNEARAAFMLKNRLDGISSRAGLREKVYTEYTSNKVIATLENTRNYNASSSELADLRRACCYAFADYLCKLAGDYVESGENVYYSVFSTETAVLAPGITQEINMAHTADDKQIRYYIATADLTSEYVDIYANYKDNDPTSWGMSRVRDQMLAAQEKYGDPESELYIENYNVIAGINGAGYDMTTGEPGGLLIMGGVEYHRPNSNGFFGILKDGTPIIGTTAEYEALHAQGLVMEGIAGFGATLVKDGELSVSYADNYTSNRASRTAVGITRTGKVVFMVMDGRQEPVSCGGSMQEIAQVMLEAGCIHAINLDGGGSTTYIAKQEGDSEISLVNSPSDGFERSVSTSLMMVSTAPSSTAFDHAVLDAETNYLTVGSSIQITASGVSPMGNAVELPENITWAVADNSIGTVDANGKFTAVSNGNTDVRVMLDDQIVGSLTVYVVVPDAIYFAKDSIDAIYGANTELPVKAQYNGKAAVMNEGDVTFTLSDPTAGTINGTAFVGDEASGLRAVSVTAALAKDPAVTATAAIVLYKQGEASFDFDQATGGDRQLAWDRQVTNATTEDNITYMAEVVGEDMTTSYIFAIDMTQIPMPKQLEELVYMLPGADVEGANSAWSFLLQLAERVHPMTEVTPVITFDPNMDVDISELSIMNEYFELQENGVQLDRETNTLTLRMNWIDRTQAIDATTANPMCILSGIKLTPKDDAQWDSQDRLSVVNTGEIGYKIYLRANALYTFAMKEENQIAYGLQPYYVSDAEKGGSFESVYKEFEDEYTLVNAAKSGWVYEDGGYAYYENGVKYTGIREVDGFYYDFGTNGINVGQNKYTGLFTEDGVAHYAKAGVLTTGWVKLGDKSYCFDENGNGYEGTVTVDEVEMVFENGLLVGGFTGFIEKDDGKTYYYVNGLITYSWLNIDGYWYHFNAEDGSMTTGTKVLPDAEAKAKSAYYDFADDGRALRAYFNPAGYYYWIGLPLADSWVKNGADPDPDAWYRTNGSGHYVTNSNKSDATVRIAITGDDGVPVVYTFDNSNGKLLKGDVVNDAGVLYYYWAGEPLTDGWYTDIDGVTYYAYEDGHLATGTQTIGGVKYKFDAAGKLQDQAPVLTVTLTENNASMNIELTNAMGRNQVRFAVWNTADQTGTLRWLDAQLGDNGVWTAVAPLCKDGLAGNYAVHAYVTTSGVQSFQTGTTIDVVETPAHVYTDRLDTTCDVCGYVREVVILPAEVSGTLSADNKELTITLTNAWDYTAVRFAVWATSVSQSQTLRWVNGEQVDESTWTVTIPMCGTGVTGSYAIHAYMDTDTEIAKEALATTTVALSALPEHTYSSETDTTCDLCGAVRELHVHNWSAAWAYDDTHHWHECSAEGCDVTADSEKSGYGEHVYDDETDATCDCGYVREIAAPEHVHAWASAWAYDETHHWHECTAGDCGVTANSEKSGYGAHVYADETDATCDCGYVREVAAPEHVHNWSSEWTYSATHHWHECSAEGCDVTANSQKSGYGEHVYDDETDVTCDCGYVREITAPEHEHDWSDEWESNSTHHWHECLAEDCDVTGKADKDGYGKHEYADDEDAFCDVCDYEREIETEPETPVIPSVPMFRMYDPNGGEHFYTGSEEERDILVDAGWNYEGVAFNFPVVGDPVHRLYNTETGDHLYTMDEDEMDELLSDGWNYEGVAFNSATSDQVPQYRVWNPNARRGAWHFTGSTDERDWLISLGWQYQGIGWYSEWV